MKNIKKLGAAFVSIMVMLTAVVYISANSFYISSTKGSVAPGESFQVNVGSDLVGVYNVSVSGGSGSVSGVWIEPSASFTVTAGNSGSVTVSVTAVDGTILGSQTDISGQTRSVTVPINNDQETVVEQEKPKEVEKSTDATLKEIKVSEGKLYPEFKKDVFEYVVVLPKDKNKIKIDATVNDSKSKVANTGNHDLKLGENVVSLIVTPEEGSEELYSIKIYLEDELKNNVSFNNEEYFVVDQILGVKVPSGYEKKKVKLDGNEVNGLFHGKWNTTLVYLQDKDQKRSFFIIDKVDGKEEYEVISKFTPISFNGQDFLLLDIPEDQQERLNMTYTDVTVAESKVKGFKYTDKNLKDFYIVRVRNDKGSDFFYQYEGSEKVWQKYPDHIAVSSDEYHELVEANQAKVTTLTIVAGVSLAVAIAVVGYTLYKTKHKTKKSKEAIN